MLARALRGEPRLASRPVVLVAAGKASDAMVRGYRAAEYPIARGMMSTTHVDDAGQRGDGNSHGDVRVFLAGHPVPTKESEAAGLHALQLMRSANARTPVVVLLSGGASALLVAPAAGLTLADKMQTTRVLLAAGAAIHELNAVRKHLSAIKGGQLAAAGATVAATVDAAATPRMADGAAATPRMADGAAATAPDGAAATARTADGVATTARTADGAAAIARTADRAGANAASIADAADVHTFALSDVISPMEDDPSVIGSGPTSPDATTFADALDALTRLRVRDEVPAAALRALEEGAAGRRAETPKPGDPRLSRARFTLIGSRRDAMSAARAEAERRGLATLVIDEPIAGEARDAAPRLLARAQALVREHSLPRPCCVIASGETTVRVTGQGLGGRNQEFALALVDPLAATADADTATIAASIGTDGIDGPTDAAGAIVDSTTRDRAARAGLPPPATFLSNNDAYHFFDPLGDLIRLGRTDTNVCDLQLMLFA